MKWCNSEDSEVKVQLVLLALAVVVIHVVVVAVVTVIHVVVVIVVVIVAVDVVSAVFFYFTFCCFCNTGVLVTSARDRFSCFVSCVPGNHFSFFAWCNFAFNNPYVYLTMFTFWSLFCCCCCWLLRARC